MNRILLFALVLFCLIGCQTAPYIIDDSQMVSMEAEFHNLRNPIITLFYTKTPGSYDALRAINNAQIKVWENGELLSGFELVVDGGYVKSGFKPKPSAKYRIEADIPDYGTLYSEIVMPPLVSLDFISQQVDSVVVINIPAYIEIVEVYNGWDTGYVEIYHGAQKDTLIYMDITIQYNDPTNQINYYKLDAQFRFFYFYNTRKPPFDLIGGVEGNEMEFFIWPIFPDNWYNDSNNQLSFIIAFDRIANMRLDLCSMFKDVYDRDIQYYYYRKSFEVDYNEPESLISFFSNSDIPDTEPVPLPQNIQGGIGFIYNTTVMQYYLNPKLPPENEWIQHIERNGNK